MLDRLKENFAAQNIELDEADMETIAGLDKGERYITGKNLFSAIIPQEDIFCLRQTAGM